MENKEDYKTKILLKIYSIITELIWLIIFFLVIFIFKDEVKVINEVEIKENIINIENAKEPDTYCSKDGILYWINGITKYYDSKYNSKERYILEVVYDNNQKPKKCNKKEEKL